MIGMVLLVSLEPVSALKVDRLTMAPTDRRRLPIDFETGRYFAIYICGKYCISLL